MYWSVVYVDAGIKSDVIEADAEASSRYSVTPRKPAGTLSLLSVGLGRVIAAGHSFGRCALVQRVADVYIVFQILYYRQITTPCYNT